jgi:alkylation response protein AidB-like acyl-CoA dehydrogenase
VNLERNEDQRDLVQVATDVCAALAEDWRSLTQGNHTNSLKALGDVGMLAVRHPEPEGTGLGPAETVLTAHACGAALAPTSLLIWADLVGPTIPGVVTGEVSVTGVFAPARGVSFGGISQMTVVIDEDGAHAFESAEVGWEPLTEVDPTTPRALMRDGLPRTSTLIADSAAIKDWRWQFALLTAAHLVGVGGGAVDTSVAYAKQRHQFGRPIGSFQAIKHLLADAYTAVEMARSQVLSAALYWAESNPGAADQAVAAAVVAARAALTASETAIQVHGGMGFTSETIPHLYYKRALLLQDELDAAGVSARQLLDANLGPQAHAGSWTPAEQR